MSNWPLGEKSGCDVKTEVETRYVRGGRCFTTTASLTYDIKATARTTTAHVAASHFSSLPAH